MISLFKYITQRNIAAFLLVLFCIQYIPLESRDGVSYLKLLVSMLCPFVIILKSPWMSKPLLLFFAYYSLNSYNFFKKGIDKREKIWYNMRC